MTTKTRAKRYTRLDNPPNFEITPRVIRVLKIICNHPLIRVDQIAALLPDIPYDALKAIIYNLFHAGFIAKPEQQQEVHNQVPGSSPMFVTPEPLGTMLYSAFFADPLPTPRYTQNNNRGKWTYIKHQHTTATTSMHFKIGADAVPGLTHLTQSDLWHRYAPANRLNQPKFNPLSPPLFRCHNYLEDPHAFGSIRTDHVPLKLKTRIQWDIKIPGQSALTDATFAVSTEPDEWIGRTYNGSTRISYREDDEGTETILPNKQIRQSMQVFFDTSLFQKYVIYITAFRDRAHLKQFGVTSFDVITFTTTPRRVDEIIHKLGPLLMQDFGINPNFILHMDRQTLESFGNNPYHPDLRYKNLLGKDVALLGL